MDVLNSDTGLDPEIPFDRLLNFRDVGQTVNTFVGKEFLRPGQLFRSSRPDECTPSDCEKLTSSIGLRAIIDLRTDTELRRQAAKYKTDPSVPEPAKLPGVTYYHINLNGKGYQNAVVAQLSWPAYIQLIFLYMGGYRIEMINLIAKHVLLKRGLVGLAVDTVTACGAEIRAMFEILQDESNYPVLLHCTQGKDRTGLTVLLVLMLLGVPSEAIDHDYRKSDESQSQEADERRRELSAINTGLGDLFARTAPDFVEKVTGEVNDKYGGIRDYLLSIDVNDDMQRRVKSLLISSG
ncbi:tyrosine/serine protein phosphatase-like protein [Eremomyces bilateralis CBS 781.70]|uniref:Tyrosine/serine protein phosphatase-like protein n=1 Tax=Eremomyces bilateralis CBS 781.70 TaxID=1392243 RepID=A0A6G1GAD1_9PEZI|nr:tyrosine/serine protein phosphatase-like protein [Eremomyces bilateralis CBS 781.70]KAF1814870.1 tyrosine/serine protein phosphatase-like protein [Eremomyces bilateralis CBS 781.70]